MSGDKETTLNDNSRKGDTTLLTKQLKLLRTGTVQGYLNAPSGSTYEKVTPCKYVSDTDEYKLSSTILTESYSGTFNGLVAYYAHKAIDSEKDVFPITGLTAARIIYTYKQYCPEDQEMRWVTDAEQLTTDLIHRIVNLAQDSILTSSSIPLLEVPIDNKVEDTSRIDKSIRQAKTGIVHTQKWNELCWTTCPNTQDALNSDVAYRLSLAGKDPNMRLKVLQWRDSALKYYGSFEFKTNQTPNWQKIR